MTSIFETEDRSLLLTVTHDFELFKLFIDVPRNSDFHPDACKKNFEPAFFAVTHGAEREQIPSSNVNCKLYNAPKKLNNNFMSHL